MEARKSIPVTVMSCCSPNDRFSEGEYNLFRGLTKGISLLLVDDHPEEVRLLGELFRRAGVRVLLATDANEALRLAREQQPNLILLDVTLPTADGFLVCRELRHTPVTREIPVLFLSGRTEPEMKLRGFAAGGRDYIAKPFIESEVIARVALHVDLARRLPPTGMDLLSSDVAPHWLTLAVERLMKDLSATPKLTDLAHAVGTNPRKLNQEFRARLGLTVFGFLRESRMKEAYRLLMDTDLSIQQIGGRVGYPLPANFATAFRERFGISPRQLRHAHDEWDPSSDR